MVVSGSQSPCPLAGSGVVATRLPGVLEARVAHTVFIQRMSHRRIAHANHRSGSQGIFDTGNTNRNGIAVQRAGSQIAGRNIGKYGANLGAIQHIYGHFTVRSGNRLTGNRNPLVNPFYIDGVELSRNRNRHGNAIVNTLKAFCITQRQAVGRIGFTNGYCKGLRITLAFSGVLSGIESMAAHRFPDGIRQSVGNPVCTDGTFNKHLSQCRIRIPTYHGTAMAIVSDQRINRSAGTETAVALNRYLGHCGRFGQFNGDKRIGNIFATGGGKLHARSVLSVRYRAEEVFGMPSLATVYGIFNQTCLSHGNAQADGSRVESTGFKTQHIETTGFERTGLRVDDRTEGIVNHHARFAFIAAHRSRNTYPITFCPILYIELVLRAVLSLNDISEPVILLPSIGYRQRSRLTVHIGRGRNRAFGTGTNGGHGIDAYFKRLRRFYRKLECSGSRMRFTRAKGLDIFGGINRQERKFVIARFEGTNRKFFTGKGNHRGIDIRNAPPHIVDIGILQTTCNKTCKSYQRIEANRLGSVNGYIEFAGIFDAYGHAALGGAVVAVGNRYGINRGEQLILGSGRIGVRGKQGSVG